MSDLIRRQATIDAMINAKSYADSTSTLGPGSYTDGWRDGMNFLLDELLQAVFELPSAEPELDEWCTDCKEYDQKRHCCTRFRRVIRETVEDVRQNARPEVVRCKDCENFNHGKDEWGNCSENPMKMWRDTDYCSWGERKEDETD